LNFASHCFASKQKLLNRSEAKNLKRKKAKKKQKKQKKTKKKAKKVKSSNPLLTMFILLPSSNECKAYLTLAPLL
jgi:hypothetical protein